MNGARDDVNDMGWENELEQLGLIPNDGTRLDSVDPATSALLAHFGSELRGLGQVPAPPPSDELAAVLAGAVPIVMARRRRALWLPSRRSLFAVAVAGVAAVTLIGLAAANDRLPDPAQGFVARVVNDWTPMHISVPQRPTSDHGAPMPTHSAQPVGQKQSGERVAPSQPTKSAAPIAPAQQPGPAKPAARSPAAGSPADQNEPYDDVGVAPIPPPNTSADTGAAEGYPVDSPSASPSDSPSDDNGDDNPGDSSGNDDDHHGGG